MTHHRANIRLPFVADRRWPGATAVILGTGPSLCPEDVDYCRGRAKIIAVNGAYKIAPFADVLYACDWRWWQWNRDALGFPGLKICLDDRALAEFPELEWMRRGREEGLEDDPGALALGRTSGHQAVNLAVHFGAAKIILLAFDCAAAPDGKLYFAGGNYPHPTDPAIFKTIRKRFAVMAPLLAARGVAVVNASRTTALEAFPRVSLVDALGLFDLRGPGQ